MKRSTQNLIVAAAVVAPLIAAAAGFVAWTKASGPDRLSIDHLGTSFTVEQKSWYLKNNTYLVVGNGTSARRVMLDDDMRFGTCRLVEVGPWVLVANDGHVVGGFDGRSGKLYGEYEWEHLPQIRWTGEGRVLGERFVADRGSLPANYPRGLPVPASAPATAPARDW